MPIQYVFHTEDPSDGFDPSWAQCTEAEYKGLRLKVTGELEASLHEPKQGHVCISITHQDFTPLQEGFDEVLRLKFDDTMEIQDRYGDWSDERNSTSISMDQARKVAAFVNKHKNCELLLIHCMAGVSRSRSMAYAIALHFRLPYKFKLRNKHVARNVGLALDEYDRMRDVSKDTASF
jgi:predicted protein tyrosine phosphatase